MILFVDTKNIETNICLFDNAGEIVDETTEETKFSQSEKLISLIDQLLSRNGFQKNDLTLIAVNPGPGSYTGIRVGVTTANFIAFGLDIPVMTVSDKNEIKGLVRDNKIKDKFSSFALPFYGKEAFITKKKPRL